MTREAHRARRHLSAPPAACHAAWLDPEALARWLPPPGMRGAVEVLEPREGGRFRIVLTLEAGPSSAAKSTADSDVIEGRFVTLDPPEIVAFDSVFESDRAEFAGTMRMTWRFSAAADGGTEAEVTADNVPPGIDRIVHETALGMSLENLERQLTGTTAGA
ncbi:MAG: SRPBCC domain-containing protein [Pseudooceanicola sp.]